jgi:hypothetical protein
MSSGWWVAAHLFATVGFILAPLGLLALRNAVGRPRAIWRSAVLPRYSGVLFGLGFALFIPQFYTPPAVRIAHGVLVAVGSTWVALAMWKAEVTN